MRVGEAAQALNASRGTIYRWVKEGRLESARIESFHLTRGGGTSRSYLASADEAGRRAPARTR